MNIRLLLSRQNAEQGNDHYRQHKFNHALSSYTMAINYDPACGALYIDRANTYYNLDKYQEAIGDYLHGIERGSATCETYNSLGTAYFKLRQFENALIAFTQAIQVNPVPVYYTNRASVYLEQHDETNALLDYNQAIALGPLMAENVNLRGNLYYNQHKFDKAFDDYDAAIKVGARLGPVFLSIFYGNRGNAYYKLHKEDEALADYSNSIALFPQAICCHARAKIHHQRKNYNEAILDLSQVIKMDDKNIEAYKCRAACYRQTQQGALADADEEKIFQLTKLPPLKDMCKYFIFANHDKVMASGVRHFMEYAPDQPGTTTLALRTVLSKSGITEGLIHLKRAAQGYLPGRTLFDEIHAEEDLYLRHQHEHRIEKELEEKLGQEKMLRGELEKKLMMLGEKLNKLEEERPGKKRRFK